MEDIYRLIQSRLSTYGIGQPENYSDVFWYACSVVDAEMSTLALNDDIVERVRSLRDRPNFPDKSSEAARGEAAVQALLAAIIRTGWLDHNPWVQDIGAEDLVSKIFSALGEGDLRGAMFFVPEVRGLVAATFLESKMRGGTKRLFREMRLQRQAERLQFVQKLLSEVDAGNFSLAGAMFGGGVAGVRTEGRKLEPMVPHPLVASALAALLRERDGSHE